MKEIVLSEGQSLCAAAMLSWLQDNKYWDGRLCGQLFLSAFFLLIPCRATNGALSAQAQAQGLAVKLF